MSIINDALKKAEQGKWKLDTLKTDAERFVLKKWLIWAGTGVVCLLGIILAVYSVKSPANNEKIADKKITTSSPISRTEQAAQVKAKAKAKLPKVLLRSLDLDLSGIVYDKQRPLAIINQRIVEEGTFVEGAKLLDIQPNSVRLVFEGREFELKLK